ncbi:saccharopine dehydrogenase-like oxidoreductase [Prorops nasuta]|uniref:saccharopine dehydrogenase-like oxidoreductase n=1 Tax=Prorops nasuta TaxID=863751 RepID=UPI0034CEE63B
MANRTDIIIFGATGFTGKHAVKEAARLAKQWKFSFGVAGRRKEALEAIVKEFAGDYEKIPVIIADLKDNESLEKMTEQAKVLVNCSGPYKFYGEPVVKACVKTRTNHVDVSGEPLYMETIQLKYNKAAQDAGIYIVSACGFDSVPCDLGVIFTQKVFDGTVNSIETYLNWNSLKNSSGPTLHYATWESAVYGLANASELRPLRQKLYPEKLPSFTPKLKPRCIVHKNSISPGWSIEFPGADRSVVRRTQNFLYNEYNQRPAQIYTYMTLKSFWTLVSTILVGAVFSVMVKFSWSRNLLLKYPGFFSAGAISHEGPSDEKMESMEFSVTCVAQGWKEISSEGKSHDKKVVTKVSGINPGYGATCTMLMLSAIMILNESDKMPKKKGVLPPGAAFGKTSYIEQLNKNGVTFEVLSKL